MLKWFEAICAISLIFACFVVEIECQGLRDQLLTNEKNHDREIADIKQLCIDMDARCVTAESRCDGAWQRGREFERQLRAEYNIPFRKFIFCDVQHHNCFWPIHRQNELVLYEVRE